MENNILINIQQNNHREKCVLSNFKFFRNNYTIFTINLNVETNYQVSYLSSYNHLFHSKHIYIISDRSHLFNKKKKTTSNFLLYSLVKGSKSSKSPKSRSVYRPHSSANDAPRYTEQTFPSRPIRMEYESRGQRGERRPTLSIPSPHHHLEPAAYLARWPVIFEGSVTGLAVAAPRSPPVFRLRAIHFALMTSFIDSYRAQRIGMDGSRKDAWKNRRIF